MDYPKKTLTRDGAALLANDDADGYNTIIDYVITSDELPDSSEELDDIEVGDFHNPQKIKISSYQHQSATFQPEATWDNATQTIKSEYPIQMFGLLAHGANDNDKDETLLAVAVADGSPFIMPATNNVPFTFTMALTLTYSNASNVTADVDNTNAVTNEQLINTLKRYDKKNNQTYVTNVYVNNQIKSLTNQNNSLVSNINNLSNSANATFETNSNALSTHKLLSDQINGLSSSANASLMNMSNSANTAHSNLQDKINSLNEDLDSNFDTISEANASYSSLMNNAKNLKDSINSLSNDLDSDTVNKITNITNNIDSFSSTTRSLANQIKSLSANVGSNVSNSLNILSTSYNNLSNAVNNTNNNIRSYPTWNDINYTRNTLIPSNDASTLNQANVYTDDKVNNKIQSTDNGSDASNASVQNPNIIYVYHNN